MTLHAPQSPDAQPSLLPVRPSSSRSTSSSVCCGSQRNSTGSPLIVVVTWILLISFPLALAPLARSNAIAAVRRASTPATLVR